MHFITPHLQIGQLRVETVGGWLVVLPVLRPKPSVLEGGKEETNTRG